MDIVLVLPDPIVDIVLVLPDPFVDIILVFPEAGHPGRRVVALVTFVPNPYNINICGWYFQWNVELQD